VFVGIENFFIWIVYAWLLVFRLDSKHLQQRPVVFPRQLGVCSLFSALFLPQHCRSDRAGVARLTVTTGFDRQDNILKLTITQPPSAFYAV
jgi:hypothetical protein